MHEHKPFFRWARGGSGGWPLRGAGVQVPDRPPAASSSTLSTAPAPRTWRGSSMSSWRQRGTCSGGMAVPKQVGVGHEGAAEPPMPRVTLHEGCCARGCGAELEAGAGAVCGVCGAAVTSVGLCVGSEVGAQGQRGCRLWWCAGLWGWGRAWGCSIAGLTAPPVPPPVPCSAAAPAGLAGVQRGTSCGAGAGPAPQGADPGLWWPLHRAGRRV